MKKEILDRAIKKAMKSACRYRVAAIAFSGKGDLISYAYNKARISSFGGGLHAEINLMRRYTGIKTIIILRVSKTGLLSPLVPCKNCKKVADKLGIKIISVK